MNYKKLWNGLQYEALNRAKDQAYSCNCSDYSHKIYCSYRISIAKYQVVTNRVISLWNQQLK